MLFFETKQEFSELGTFQLNSLETNNNDFIVEMSYRKSDFEGVQLIDLMIEDITNIVKAEEEKADIKYRRQYLSNVAHEFKAPIQVLLATVFEIDKSKLPEDIKKKFEDINDLGNYIMLLIMDIISFSKDNFGVEIKVDQFDLNNSLIFGQRF